MTKLSKEDSYIAGRQFISDRHKRINFSMERESVYNLVPIGRYVGGDHQCFWNGIIDYLDLLEPWLN